jgi:capsular exopolysaccharide synthesis family protein
LELSDYLRIVRRNWIVLVACAMAGLLLSGTAALLTKPTYTSNAQLFVAIQNSGSVAELQQGNTFSQARVQSYVRIVTTPNVLQPVIDNLGLATTPDTLSKQVSAKVDPNTVLISIVASDTSPVQAAAIAQAVADSLIRSVDALEKPAEGGASPIRLSIVKPATPPATPSAPDVKQNLALGAICGLLVGIFVALLRTTLDTKIRGEADLRRVTEVPMLAGIAYDNDAVKKPLLTQTAPQSPRAESFRQLRTNLQFAHVSHASKTVLVTSSVSGEGKSTTATNLALAMAESGKTVALVDADLRRPMVAEYLGLEKGAGLTTVLIGDADINEVLQPWGSNQLYVLTSGQIPPNPSEMLGSESMRDLISRLEEAFDAVVIDAPPLLPVTDAAVLSQRVGGVVLVVGAQSVKAAEVQKSIRGLELVDAELLGIVLNKLPAKGADAYSYSYASRNLEAARVGHDTDKYEGEEVQDRTRPPSHYPAEHLTSGTTPHVD